MKREQALVKNTIILFIGSFLPKATSFIVLPILTGKLTKAEYGTYDLITVLVSLFLPAITLQIQTAAFRFLIDAKEDENKKTSIITNIFAFTLTTSIVAVIVGFFCLYKIGDYQERLLICLYLLFDILSVTIKQIARGFSKNLDYSISSIVGSIGRMIFAIVFVNILDQGLKGATLCLVVATLLETIYLCARTRIFKYINFKYIGKDQLKQLLAYSWPLVPNNISGWLMRLSDRLVISIFMGVSANAIYSVANKIPSLLITAQNTFNMSWQENASIASKDDDAEKYYSDMFGYVFDFMAGAFSVIIAATPILFAIFVRGSYEESLPQIPILLLASFFFSIASYLGGIYIALYKTKSVGITTVLAAVSNIIINVGLIKFIGIYAASLSTFVSYVLLMVFRMINIRKYVKINYNYKKLFAIIAALLVVCGIYYIPGIWPKVLNGVLGLTIFLVLNWKTVVGFITSLISKGKSKVNHE